MYHLTTDLGLPVLKPDRVVCRVLTRLGKLEHEDEHFRAIHAGRTLARVTGHSIRYVDRVLVALGQQATPELGLDRGICLKDRPQCDLCHARPMCRWTGSTT